MRKFLAIARTGLVAVLLQPLRSLVTIACIVAVVLPYTAGEGVAHGLRAQAALALAAGADLHLSGSRFGRAAPLPLAEVERARAVPGVRDVVPRIVGTIALGEERLEAVVVGLPAERLPSAIGNVEGRLFSAGARNELVVGAELARRLGLRVGARLPPFYRNERGEHVSTVVGIFSSDLLLWESNLLFCSLETAAAIFAQEGFVTGLLVSCTPGYEEAVANALARLQPDPPMVTSRDDLQRLLPRALRHMEGIFQLHFLLAFAVGIPLLMVTSGLGQEERRREAALLRATGWMSDELLLRGMVESLVLCLIGASLSILLAYFWMGVLGARGVAGVFLPGTASAPGFRVPFQLTPVPAFLSFLVSFSLVAVGTVYSVWRAATTPPGAALR